MDMKNTNRLYLLNILFFLNCHTNVCSLHDLPIFFKTFFHDPSSVGALFPCSDSVGIEITKYLARFIEANPQAPVAVLEVGAGTGSITTAIAAKLRPCDHLDAVELSSEFCKVLHQKFDSNSCVRIQDVSILDWKPDYHYDFIISTLPLNSLKADLVEAIIEHLKRLIKPNGVVSYVAYTGMSTLKGTFLWGQRKHDHRKKMRSIEAFRDQYLIEKTTVLINCPPINIYHCRIGCQ